LHSGYAVAGAFLRRGRHLRHSETMNASTPFLRCVVTKMQNMEFNISTKFEKSIYMRKSLYSNLEISFQVFVVKGFFI